MKKKILASLLALCMVFSLLPVSVLAEPAPEISADVEIIKVGAVGATVTLTADQDFSNSLTVGDFTVNAGDTDLVFSAASSDGDTNAELTFTGTAAEGELTIQAKASAFDPEADEASNTITITVSDAPIISADVTTISVGSEGATVTLTADQDFSNSLTVGDFTVNAGDTDLVFSAASSDGDTNAELTFTGNAAEGELTIQAKATAFEDAEKASNTITITVEAPALSVTPDSIDTDEEDPSFTVTVANATFVQGEVNTTNVTASGVDGLTVDSVTYGDANTITVAFTGSAEEAGTLTISVAADALSSDAALTVPVTVTAAGSSDGQTASPSVEGNPIFGAEEGNIEVQIPVSNESAYSGAAITVNVYTESGNAEASGVSGSYSNGILTLTFTSPLTAQTTYQISFTANGKSESEMVKVTVAPYMQLPTATPEFSGTSVVAQQNNTLAEIYLTNGDKFNSTAKVKVYTTESDTTIASGVSGTYTNGVIILTFNPAITSTRTYYLTLQETGKSESEARLKVTVTPAPSSSGGSSSGGTGGSASGTTSGSATTPGTTVKTTTATSTTTGTTASATVSSSTLNSTISSAVTEAAQKGTVPVVEVKVNTSAAADSLEVTLPAASLETLAGANNSSLVITSEIAEVTLDHTALAALVSEATGSTISLEVAPVAETALNTAQKEAVSGAEVVDLSLVSDGVAIHDYNSGTITVSLPYTLKSGETAGDIVVYYLGDDGSLTRCATSYAGGKVTFTTNHLSKYVIGTRAMAPEPSAAFVDVPVGEYYADAVAWAVANGVTKGTDDTHFSPNNGCTRAQFVTFLWRASGSPEPAGSANPFSDVSETAHADYYKAILWAAQQGVTTGTGDGTTFSPSAVVTRAQAVTFMYRCAQKAGIATATGVASFDDISNEGALAAYYDAIGWAVANGITNGNSATANTFGPMDDCNRAMMITFLYRLFTA